MKFAPPVEEVLYSPINCPSLPVELFHTFVTPYRPFPHVARTAEDDAITRTVLPDRVKVYRLPQLSSDNVTDAGVLDEAAGFEGGGGAADVGCTKPTLAARTTTSDTNMERNFIINFPLIRPTKASPSNFAHSE